MRKLLLLAADEPALRGIVRQAEKNMTAPALIEAIVKSPQFQMRKARGL
jgi:hypothetical protein